MISLLVDVIAFAWLLCMILTGGLLVLGLRSPRPRRTTIDRRVPREALAAELEEARHEENREVCSGISRAAAKVLALPRIMPDSRIEERLARLEKASERLERLAARIEKGS